MIASVGSAKPTSAQPGIADQVGCYWESTDQLGSVTLQVTDLSAAGGGVVPNDQSSVDRYKGTVVKGLGDWAGYWSAAGVANELHVWSKTRLLSIEINMLGARGKGAAIEAAGRAAWQRLG